jgi:predicted ArsR family transcriptional regulator
MDEIQSQILRYLLDAIITSPEGLTEHELCKHLGLQIRQARKALSALTAQGYIEVVQLSERWGRVQLVRPTETGIDAARPPKVVTVIQGDVINATVGDDAQNVVIGKNVTLSNTSPETKDPSDPTQHS